MSYNMFHQSTVYFFIHVHEGVSQSLRIMYLLQPEEVIESELWLVPLQPM